MNLLNFSALDFSFDMKPSKYERTFRSFSLLVRKLNKAVHNPYFKSSVKRGEYSNRCPFAEFHAKESLVDKAKNRNLPLKIVKLKSIEDAQKTSCPATIFSVFLNGKFMTTDSSVCITSRNDKEIEKLNLS